MTQPAPGRDEFRRDLSALRLIARHVHHCAMSSGATRPR
jgi:hypothetical protein